MTIVPDYTTIVLNPDLLVEQGITGEKEMTIRDWHYRLQQVMALMETTDDPEFLRMLAELVEQIEYRLQDAWGFPHNRYMHSWWIRVPKCRCPKMDNAERYGTPYRIISGACPVHARRISLPGELEPWERRLL